MAIFQPSVLKNFPQDESKIAQRWAKYQEFLSKIDYIKTQKEEKYQDGFLRDIFENTLGYTLDMTNPQSFNLEREKIKFADKLAERNFKNDWLALFENDKIEVLQIQNQINQTDKEIDNMVYELYGLSDDEIKIVEGI